MNQRYMAGMRKARTFSGKEPLSNAALEHYAPAIFAEEAHDSRSDRYAYLSTKEVVTALRSEGFHPFFVAQSRSRDKGKAGFTKHMLRFRHESMFAAPAGEFNEVVLVNSHDGTSAYHMMAGRYRMVCANGLVAGETISSVKFPHKGIDTGIIIEGAYTVLDEFDKVDRQVASAKQIQLAPSEQYLLANGILQLRYDMEKDFRPSQKDILAPRRREDTANDLWTVFNRIQENVIQGQVPLTINPPSTRSGTSRPLTAVSEVAKINRQMWDVMDAMRQYRVYEELI
jgi:hypothetical protein